MLSIERRSNEHILLLLHPPSFYVRDHLDLLDMKRRKKGRKGISRKKSLGILFAVIIIVSILFVYYLLFMRPSPSSQPFQFKAAIVDHLSLTAPNPTFIQKATNILKEAGYTVEYHSGEEVTVNFYRNLPTHGYSLLVLRVHSTFTDHSVALFTSENYSYNKYRDEQWPIADRLGAVAYTMEEAEKEILYFGILPSFVKHSMKGTFNNTVIIMMGCDGLMYEPMAEAFVQKGARVYISWDGPVSASHTDQATTRLLEHLITERKTIKQAVTETREEVGPDPVDESILLYHPTTPEAENYVIPEPKSNITTNVAKTNPKIERLRNAGITMAKIMKKSEKMSIK